MNEQRLQQVECELGEAEAETAAAVAVAAILRIGEIGLAAGKAFDRLTAGAESDPDMIMLVAGVVEIEGALARLTTA